LHQYYGCIKKFTSLGFNSRRLLNPEHKGVQNK
jgi:hypothetical protein